MSEHTKEPWKVIEWDDGSFSIHDQNDDLVIHFGKDDRIEDARRIVACVNACVGIQTETMELIGRLVKTGRPHIEPISIIDNLKGQRDELLKAIDGLLDPENDTDESYRLAYETIAKVRGGA